MSTLKITTIQCITTSTGVAGWWEKTVSAVSTVLGEAIGGAAATTASIAIDEATAGFGVLLTPVLAGGGSNLGGTLGGALASATNSLSKSLGQDIADQLYVKVNDKKVWPSDRDHRIKSGQSVSVNYETTFSGSVNVKLMEWDHIKDDNLGETVFNANSTSGVYMFGNPKEQDLYAVEIEITP